MNKPLTFMIPFLIASLFVGTLTMAPTQMSDESFISAQTGTLAFVAGANTDSKAIAPQASTPSNLSQVAATASTSVQAVANTAPTQNPTVSKIPSRPAPVPATRSVASRGGSSPSPAPAPANQSRASAIIATAKQYLGVKYVWGGTTPAGFDCSGFSQYVFAQHGISLPRVSRDQYNVGHAVSYANLQPGDLVFFALGGNGIDHLGIYIGGGKFINASTSKGVTIYSFGSYWTSHFVGARRVI